MGFSLSRSPSPKAEYAYRWWVDKLHNARCDHCEDWVPISGVQTAGNFPSGDYRVYCSDLCFHLEEQPTKGTDLPAQIGGGGV